jgi:glycosyltransferase involved in cell wall biosynthesis
MKTSPELIVPKVSIIIPVYNRERYLGFAVRSVLDQTFTDFELIIVDDGSTDGSLEIAQQFAAEDNRVRVLTLEVDRTEETERGAAYALKAGYELARGEYVGQVDSDDWIDMRAIERMVAVFDDDAGCGMVYSNYIDVDENGKQLRPGWRCSYDYSVEKLLSVFMTFHFRLMRRSVYERAGGIDLMFDLMEDWDLCLRISEITRISHILDFLYFYRNHSDMIHQKNPLQIVLLANAAIEAALKRRGMDKTHRLKVRFNPERSIEEINPIVITQA